MSTVPIHYHRPGKPLTVYTEGLVSDNGICLRTLTVLPPDISARLSASMRRENLLRADQSVGAVAKTYFYNEQFNLLEFRDPSEALLGHYSDIGTPLLKTADGYAMTDWFLDLWLPARGQPQELDWDEFHAAIAAGLLTAAEANLASKTLARLVREATAGTYPSKYLSA